MLFSQASYCESGVGLKPRMSCLQKACPVYDVISYPYQNEQLSVLSGVEDMENCMG